MKKSPRSLVCLLILILVFLSFLGLTSSYATYSTPKKISSTANNTYFPQLVPDTDGYLHLAWMEADVDWLTRPNPGVFYSRWNGDTWSSPVKISVNTTGFAELPGIAVDANKIVHVVFDDDSEFGEGHWRVYYTKRELNGQWTTPVLLPHPPAFYYAYDAKITVDTSNNLHVVYSVIDEQLATSSFYYTKYDVGLGSWSEPVLISYMTDGVTPTVYTQWGEIYGDKLGNVHLIYWDWANGVFYRKLQGGSWSTPVYVVNAVDVEFAKLTVDDNGNPFVIWFQTREKKVYVRRTVSQVWQDPEVMGLNAQFSLLGLPIISITTTSKNVIAAGWAEQGSGPGLFDVVYRYYQDGLWSAPDYVRVDRPWPESPFLIRDKWDNQHLVWSETASIYDPKADLWYSVVQGKQQTVGTAGGTVIADPSGVNLVSLVFGNGALSADTLITVLIGPLPESVDPLVVTVPRAFTFGPEGLTFPANKLPTITFTYTDAELEGGDPKTLNAFVWDSQTSSYTARAGRANTAQKTLAVTDINHFSLFAMAAKKVFLKFLPPFDQRVEVQQDATLPLRFKLTYHDGSLVPEGEVIVQLKQGETLIKEFSTLDGSVKYNKEGFYHLNFSARGLEIGEYQIVIFRDGPKVGQTSLKIVRK